MKTDYIVAKQRLSFSDPPRSPEPGIVSLVTPSLFQDLVNLGYEIMSIDIEGTEAFAVCKRPQKITIGEKAKA